MTSDLPPAGGPNPASSNDAGAPGDHRETGTPAGTTQSSSGQTSSGPTGSGPAGSPWRSGARAIDDSFAWIRGLGIYRASSGRWAAGVASGLARRWNLDPILVRGIFVALTFAGGIGVGLYGLAWLLLPEQDGRIHLQQALSGRFSAGFVGSVILTLGLFGDPGPWHNGWFSGPPRFLAWLLLVALIWWIVRTRHDGDRYGWRNARWHHPGPGGDSGATSSAGSAPASDTMPEYGAPSAGPAASRGGDPRVSDPRASDSRTAFSVNAPAAVRPEPGAPGSYGWQPAWVPPVYRPDPSWPSKRNTRFTLGLALLVAGAVLLAAHQFDAFDAPAGLIAGAAALAVIAASVLTAGLRGRRSGGLSGIGILLMAAVLIGTGVHQAGVRSGQHIALAGEYAWAPVSARAAEQQYNLGAGQATLDLTNPALLDAATMSRPLIVNVRLGVGQLTVTLPEGENLGTAVQVDLGAGQVTQPDGQVRQVDGTQHRVTVEQKTHPTDLPVLIVRVHQGAGEVVLKNGSPALPRPALTTPST